MCPRLCKKAICTLSPPSPWALVSQPRPCHKLSTDVGSECPLQVPWQLQFPASFMAKCFRDSQLVSPFPPLSCSLSPALFMGAKAEVLKPRPTQFHLLSSDLLRSASSHPREAEAVSSSRAPQYCPVLFFSLSPRLWGTGC